MTYADAIRRAADFHNVMAIIYPKLPTLEKYGMDEGDYRMYYEAQDGVCAVCEKPPKEGKTLNVDHEHVKGWKKMPPEKRKKFVRGLLCFYCNRFYLSKAMTIPKAEKIKKYLEAYNVRQGKVIQGAR